MPPAARIRVNDHHQRTGAAAGGGGGRHQVNKDYAPTSKIKIRAQYLRNLRLY
jgi:hypothetical protein